MTYQNEFETRELKCVECSTSFQFTAGEQKYYAERNFTPPKRCPECRQKKKERTEKQGFRR